MAGRCQTSLTGTTATLFIPAGRRQRRRRIQHSVAEVFEIHDKQLSVSASISISLSTPGLSSDDLIRDADIAMHDVTHTALETLAGWRQEGLVTEEVCTSVNLSGRQLDDPGWPTR